MSARIHRLRTRPDQSRRVELEQNRQFVLALEGAGLIRRDTANDILGAIAKAVPPVGPNTWDFILMSPAQNEYVVNWLLDHSKRPRIAVRLWAKCIVQVVDNSGEVRASRAELAEAIGCAPNHLSAALSELVGMRALVRVKEGRGNRYFLNPLVGTRLGTGPREVVQAAAPQLRLVEPA